MKAEAPGFKTFEHRDVQVESIQTVRIDVRGGGIVGSEVTVTAGAPVIETDAATISDTKYALQLRDLPLNTLNGLILNAFSVHHPDRLSDGGSKFAMGGGARYAAFTTTSTGSARTRQRSAYRNSPAEPSAESIAEMKFNLVNNRAEFGEVTNVTAITKSGQNELHGRLFEQNTTSALNARSFFAASKGKHHQRFWGIDRRADQTQ